MAVAAELMFSNGADVASGVATPAFVAASSNFLPQIWSRHGFKAPPMPHPRAGAQEPKSPNIDVDYCSFQADKENQTSRLSTVAFAVSLVILVATALFVLLSLAPPLTFEGAFLFEGRHAKDRADQPFLGALHSSPNGLPKQLFIDTKPVDSAIEQHKTNLLCTLLLSKLAQIARVKCRQCQTNAAAVWVLEWSIAMDSQSPTAGMVFVTSNKILSSFDSSTLKVHTSVTFLFHLPCAYAREEHIQNCIAVEKNKFKHSNVTEIYAACSCFDPRHISYLDYSKRLNYYTRVHIATNFLRMHILTYPALFNSVSGASVIYEQSHDFQVFRWDDAFSLSNFLANISVAIPTSFELTFSDNFLIATLHNETDSASCSSCHLFHKVSPSAAASPSEMHAQVSIAASSSSPFTVAEAPYSINQAHIDFSRVFFHLAIFFCLIQMTITFDAFILIRAVLLRFVNFFHRPSRPRGFKLGLIAFSVFASSLSLGVMGQDYFMEVSSLNALS
jgi:hypothetical protein